MNQAAATDAPASDSKTGRVLALLSQAKKPLRTGEIAQRLGIDQATAAALCKALYDRGLVVRCQVDTLGQRQYEYKIAAGNKAPEEPPAPHKAPERPVLRPGADAASKIPSFVPEPSATAQASAPVESEQAQDTPPADTTQQSQASDLKPESVAEQVRQIFRAAAHPLTSTEAADALPHLKRDTVQRYIHWLHRCGDIVREGHKEVQSGRFHGIVTAWRWAKRAQAIHGPGTSDAAPVGPQDAIVERRFRFGLYSDGTLVIEGPTRADGSIALAPEHVHELAQALAAMCPQSPT
jgi:hypothetical protein